MKISDVVSFLESFAPLACQEDYDNSGLICGAPHGDAKGILLSIDCTEDVVNEAKQKNCNLVISHHPAVFTGLKRFTGATLTQRTIISAIRSDIALYAIHTNLDNIREGVNAKIAERTGLINLRILRPKKKILRKLFTFCPVDKAQAVRNALFEAGAGHIGNYSECSFGVEGYGTFKASDASSPYVGEKNKQHREKEEKIEVIYPFYLEERVTAALFRSHPYEEVAYDIVELLNEAPGLGSGMVGDLPEPEEEESFLKRVKAVMNASCLRHTPLLGKKVERVAVCGGSGSFLLKDAIAAKADVFLTADVKYHQFFDAEGRIVIADPGHYESEQFTTELLHELLSEKFPTFAIHFSEKSTNPINYL